LAPAAGPQGERHGLVVPTAQPLVKYVEILKLVIKVFYYKLSWQVSFYIGGGLGVKNRKENGQILSVSSNF
jgi:hypothetical protein